MKPCSKNRPSLSLLAVNALERSRAESLRLHLRSCPGCRVYLAEISGVVQTLGSMPAVSELEVPSGFHRELSRRIRAESSSGFWPGVKELLRTCSLNWRMGMPPAAVAVTLVAAWLAVSASHNRHNTAHPTRPIAFIPDMPKTTVLNFATYRILASRSPEALDQEMAREAACGSSDAPIYA